MASTQHVLLSPAELAYLHSSLSQTPPIRPDGRTATQFRPLVAETGILPGTNGSARICFADGTEAIVGVKAEVEATGRQEEEGDEEGEGGSGNGNGNGSDWVEMSVEIPGVRDDDSGTAFLAAMLSEAVVADGGLVGRLRINGRFHWKLYLDILLISPPLSYPLPLLSLTTHLALLATRLPRLKSEGDEDPFFDDDWAAATYLYPRGEKRTRRPPVTLLVMAVGKNIIFDPSKEELAVADVTLAVSVGEESKPDSEKQKRGRRLKLVAVRTVDPPSRLTPPGVPNAVNAAYGAGGRQKQTGPRPVEPEAVEGVWRAPRGGAKPVVMAALVQKTLEAGGVADEVLDALDGVDLG
ncbi:ribosomal protein S5 domain 2-type protein [Echria macrotheca]|uniref:Ribosomal RNA-processing protein 42 n=1 Tax=Echria macrotheca TaxID=438768 RepID=A0AAJ0FFG8_9PEZI|nr:ribosomal protein S5 domain 2-type protein [Echria macrotheca]